MLNQYKTGVLMLACICGLIDAACFLALGGLFAELMTGNLLTMAFAIGTRQFEFEVAVSYACAIVPFCIGAFVAGLAIHHPILLARRGKQAHGARLIGYPLEFALVALAAILALVLRPDPVSPILLIGGEHVSLDWNRLTILGLLSFGMGIHNGIMRRKGVPDVATNVMTLTLTGLFSESPLAGGPGTHWQRRAGSIFLFVLGAAAGAFLLDYGVAAPLCAAAILFGLALYPLLKGDEDDSSVRTYRTN